MGGLFIFFTQLVLGIAIQESVNWTTWQIDEVSDRLNTLCYEEQCCDGFVGWAEVSGIQSELKDSGLGNRDGAETTASAVKLGVYKKSVCGPVYGGFVSYGQQELDFDATQYIVDTDSFLLGAFVRSDSSSAFRYKAIGFWGRDTYDMEGNENRVSGSETRFIPVVGEASGHRAGIYAEGSRSYCTNCLEIEPVIALQYLHVSTKRFYNSSLESKERYDYDKANTDSFRSFVGARMGYCSGCFVPSARIQWVHEILDESSTISPLFNLPRNGRFAADRKENDKDWLVIGLGANWMVSNCFNFFASYDAQVGEHTTLHHGKVGLEFSW